MIYVISQYWIFAALAALLGAAVGWLTCARQSDQRLGWLMWGLGALVLGVVLAISGAVPGFGGHALEIAVLLFIAYLVGCWLGCLLKRAFGGADEESASPASGKSGAGKPAARGDGKTAALAGAGAAGAVAAAAAARAQREAAKAKAKADADARSHAKFVEEEAARAKAEAERLAREKTEADAKAKRQADLAAREEELAREGRSTPPARDFSVAKGDALTWIGRIGPHAEGKLNGLGIRKFAQIAAWTPSNGRWIDERLGEPGRVAREDWVAQAQRLARGEMTDHARAVKSGAVQIDDAPPAKPKPEKPAQADADADAKDKNKDKDKRGANGESAPGADKGAPAAAAMTTVAAVKALVEQALPAGSETSAGATREGAHAPADGPTQDAMDGDDAANGVTAIAEAAKAPAPLAYAPARPREDAGHGGLTPALSGAAPSPAISSAAVDAPRVRLSEGGDGPRDDLKWIRGVGPVNEGVLNGLGVRRFTQIAAWSPETAQWVGRHMRLSGRIEREGWIEQARLLAAGVMTDHANAAKAGEIDMASADAMLDEADAQRFLATLPQPAAPVDGEDEHDGARPLGLTGPRGERADDLKLIRGVGPQNEQRLHALGVWHFDQIAAWSAENVKWVGSYLAFPGRIDRERWIEQAGALARGQTPDLRQRAAKSDPPTTPKA